MHAATQGKNVLRKEPMSKDISDTDSFVFNDKFTSKLVKVKISTIAATKVSSPKQPQSRKLCLLVCELSYFESGMCDLQCE